MLTYRFVLGRTVAHLAAMKIANFIMLNPSTADERNDDATIRKCLTLARYWGCSHLRVTNLFAMRATSPVDLVREATHMPHLAVGEDNDEHIAQQAIGADLIVCAWGTHGRTLARGSAVVKLLRNRLPNRKLHALKLTKDGHPAHPLYLKGDTQPFVWNPVGY